MSTNDSLSFTVGLSGSSATLAGFNLSVNSGTLAAGGNSQLLDPGTGGTSELTHVNRNSTSWTFTYTAPNFTGTQTLYVCVNQVDGNSASSNDQPTCTTKNVSITNSSPTITFFGGGATYTEDGSAVAVDSSITLADVDGDSLNRAIMTITNVQTGDTLSCPGCAGAGLSGVFSSGALTITGTATTATYDSVLQGVTFSNSSQSPSTTQRTITLTVRDTFNNTSSTANGTLNVTAVNDPPVLTTPASIGVTEDSASALTGISVSDADASSGSLTYTFTVGSGTLNAPVCTGVTTGGTATARTLAGTTTNLNNCISGSNFTFTTASNSTSTVSLGVSITDNGNTGTGGAQSDSATVNLTVTGVNDAPSISAPASIGVTEDVASALTGISFSDIDAGSSSLTATFSVGSGALNSPSCASVVAGGSTTARTLTGSAANLNSCISGSALTFTTASNATASVTLGVALSDNGNTGSGGAQVATPANVTLTVTNVNDAPTAINDSESASKNSSNNEFDVLANDTDPDPSETLTLVSVGVPSNGGSAVVGSPCAANRVCYAPATNFSGTETISYTMRDAAMVTSSATLTVTVGTGVAPVAGDDATTVLEDSSGNSIDALANDNDSDIGDTEEIVAVNGSSSFPVTTVNGGSVSLSATGIDNQLIYTPAANFFGTDTFTYTVRDAGLLTDTATVTVTVTGVNDAPTLNAIGNPAAIDEDASLQTVNLSGIGAGTAEMQTLTVTATSSNTAVIPHPTVSYTSASATGSISYTPVANASGSATITITVTDDGGTTNGGVDNVQRTFTATVNPVNDTPTVSDVANQSIGEDGNTGALAFTIGDVETAAGSLTVSGSSSNTTLVPNANIVFGGSGASRTVTVTPAADQNGSATITISVSDGAAAGADTFTLTVGASNDAPVIGAIADQVATDNQLFTLAVSVTDADGETSFGYSLTTAPAGMAIDGSGTITWTPPVGTSGSFPVTVQATDGSSATDTESFNVVVSAPDTDGDGMPDSYEDLYPGVLDKNDPTDANEDPDRDGLTNLEEYAQLGNPTVDDVPPLLAAPADLVVPATGYYTVVDLGDATASDGKDGALSATSDWTLPVVRPGRYTVNWTVQDQAGNVATDTQQVDVLPLADFNVDQTVDGNGSAIVTVTLNGIPPEYPVSIPYAESGLNAGSGGTLVISSGASVSLNVDFNGAPSGTYTLTMTDATNAVIGTRDSHTITVVNANVRPDVELSTAQGALPRLVAYQGDGAVTITAGTFDANGDVLTYNWAGSADALGIDGTTAPGASFDPSALPAGAYPVTVVVSDGSAQSTATVLVVVVPGSSPEVDVDADGIFDSVDAVLDDPGLLEDQTGDPPTATLLETESGLSLRRGRTSLAAGRTGALILMSDLVSVGVGEGGIALGADSYENVGGLFDFEVHGLAVGGTARVVLPLQTAIRAGSVYRKFDPIDGWHDFIVDAGNALASARASFGQCPGPASDAYVDGLQPFADCVRLTLTDGGLNDADGVADGVIRDPGGVAFVGTTEEDTTSVSSGAFLALWLLPLAALRLRRRAAIAVLALATLLAMAPAQADHHVRIHYSGDVASGFDDNVTNAQHDADIRESGFGSATGNMDYVRMLSLYTTLLLRGSLQGEYWNSFDGLNNGKATAMARLLYRGDGDFFTPTFAGWVSASVWEFDSAIRDSNEYRLGAYVMENLTTQITGRFALGASRRESDGLVFDMSGYSASLNLDWVPAPRMVVYTGYQYYVGDVASTATPSLWIGLAAEAIEADDAFGGLDGGLRAYRLDAKAHIFTMGFNYAFSRKLSADVQGQYITTRADAHNEYERMVGVVSLLARF